MPSRALQEIVEYRGVEGLVCAEVLSDDNGAEGYKTGEVFAIAGVAEISKTTASSNEAHFYDNIPAIVVSSTSNDEVTITTSAIPFDVLAAITGQYYDATTGSLIEGPRAVKYYAIGYQTKKTNGDKVFVWRYKGTFNIPDQTSSTENDSTDANGQELVYTGVSTTHKFAKTGEGSKALVVDVAKGLANVDNFFDTVVTPDSISGNSTFNLSITQAEGTVVTVTSNGVPLASGDDIFAGQELKISATGVGSNVAELTVDGADWVSGDIKVVAANVSVVSSVVT